MEWYYAEGSSQKGPISDSDFKAMVESGQITSKTLVWNGSMKNWAEYGTIASGATAAASAGQTATCSECQGEFPADQMVQYERHFICAKCKPVFFQRIQEGGSMPSNFGSGGTGQTHNRDLMTQARDTLSGRWGEGVIFVLAYIGVSFGIGIISGIIPILGNLVSLLVTGPIMVGFYAFWLNFSRGETVATGVLFKYFEKFGACLSLYLLMSIFIVLWMLLLIVPGIIKALRYSMAFFIMSEDPDITAYQALTKSEAMMKGSCWKFFCLNCRFIGWSILCLFTLGIGFLWLTPYSMTSYAKFYEDVRGKVAGS